MKRVQFLVRIEQMQDRQTAARVPKVHGQRRARVCKVALMDDECIEWNGKHGKPNQLGSHVKTTNRRPVAARILCSLSRSLKCLQVVECCLHGTRSSRSRGGTRDYAHDKHVLGKVLSDSQR